MDYLNSERKTRISIVVTVALLIVCTVLFWGIIKTVIFAATISVVSVPLIRKFENKLWPQGAKPWQKTFSALLVTSLALFILAGFLLSVFFVVYYNFAMLRDFSIQLASYVQDGLTNMFDMEDFKIKRMVTERLNEVPVYIQGIFLTLADLVTHTLLFSFSLYIFNRHGEGLVEACRRLIPDEHSDMVGRFKVAAYSSFYAIYVVHLGTAILTFLLAIPFFLLIGYEEHLMFWSLLCGIFQFIPIVGPSMIMFSISGYAFATGDSTTGILLLAVGYPVVSGGPDVIFRPLMMGREMKLNPLILILGFFGGIMSMGVIGFIIGPVLLKILIESFHISSEYIMKKNGQVST